MPTVDRILELAPPSGYLASKYVGQSRMYKGEVLDPSTPIWIYIIYKILNTIYEEDNDYDGTVQVANYLYTLLSPFYFEAAEIVDAGGGGQIPGVTPGGGGLNALDFEVSASSPMVTGATSITLDGTNGNPDFRGVTIVNLARGGVWQNTTSLGDGSTFYTWNSVTGVLSVNVAVTEGELIRITPDTGGGSGSTTSVTIGGIDVITLSGDGTYSLSAGSLLWKISILPTIADTVRIGTTLNGEEVMPDKVMITGSYGTNGVTADVYAVGSAQTIYFTGFTGTATIIIFTLPLS